MLRITRKQAGMTMIGWLVVIALIAFFVRIVTIVYPILYNQFKVTSQINELVADPETAKLTPKEIYTKITRRFEIDNVDSVGDKQLKVTYNEETRKTLIEVNYEVRTQFWGPIYIVGVFNEPHVEVARR